ncbi:MAG TPA: antibiotic biosynthesis monooxygenase [Burkholderiaceae bacterium]|jgi:heme-degrading monooxygenase HmoA|nr:antibiotic biosynthesis monooxygenase [Burkholderiaceae bacterium]
MSTSRMARTPQPPYYAVIFTSIRTAGDRGYAETADRMVELASGQPGFLGVESVRDSEGVGITVSYWESTAALQAWKAQAEHLVAQQRGQRDWYQHYEVRVARVERAYGPPEPSR